MYIRRSEEALHFFWIQDVKETYTAWKLAKYKVFFWFVFSCIRTEYGDLLHKSPYSVRIEENTDQKKLCTGYVPFTSWRKYRRVLSEYSFLFQVRKNLEKISVLSKNKVLPRCLWQLPISRIYFQSILSQGMTVYLTNLIAYLWSNCS